MLDQVFPEYSSLFSDTFGKSSLELLSSSCTPEEILAMDTENLISILNSASKGRLGSDKATEIKHLIEQIKFIEAQITELERQIHILLEKLDTPIQTLPSVGPVLGAIILSEIGDITRFKDASKLVVFSGIDPSVKQSGRFISTHNKMSKQDSPYLHRAIFLAAQVVAFNDRVLSTYYQKSVLKVNITTQLLVLLLVNYCILLLRY